MSTSDSNRRIELLSKMQERVDVLTRLIAQEEQKRWRTEAVLREDRRLLTEAMMLLAEKDES